jgi:hypothetical protein
MCGETLLIEEANVSGSTPDLGLRMLLLWKHLHWQRLLLLVRARFLGAVYDVPLSGTGSSYVILQLQSDLAGYGE